MITAVPGGDKIFLLNHGQGKHLIVHAGDKFIAIW